MGIPNHRVEYRLTAVNYWAPSPALTPSQNWPLANRVLPRPAQSTNLPSATDGEAEHETLPLQYAQQSLVLVSYRAPETDSPHWRRQSAAQTRWRPAERAGTAAFPGRSSLDTAENSSPIPSRRRWDSAPENPACRWPSATLFARASQLP